MAKREQMTYYACGYGATPVILDDLMNDFQFNDMTPYIMRFDEYVRHENNNIWNLQEINTYVGNAFQEVIIVEMFDVTTTLEVLLKNINGKQILNNMWLWSTYHRQ